MTRASGMLRRLLADVDEERHDKAERQPRGAKAVIDHRAATRLSAVVSDGKFPEHAVAAEGEMALGNALAAALPARIAPVTVLAASALACLWAGSRANQHFGNPVAHAATGGGFFGAPTAAAAPMFGAGRDPGETGGDPAMNPKNSARMAAMAMTAAVTANGALAGDAVQWRVADGGNGHWYQAIKATTPLNWSAARDRATSVGGHLATFESEGEFPAVVGPIAADVGLWIQATWWRGPWIGAYQDHTATDFAEPAGGWRWVTGAPVATSFFAGFGYGNPNNYPCCEDYLQIGENPLVAAVNDVPQSSTAIALIVEWEADCNNDGIVDYGQCHDGSLQDTNGNNTPDCCEAGMDCEAAASGIGRCAVFARGTDTVAIIGSSTELQGDYTIEWSGYPLNQTVATNPPATWNARIWSEQDSVTVDKGIGLNPNRSPWAWVNSPCRLEIEGASALNVVNRTHVAIVRSNGATTMFVNGDPISSLQDPCEPFNSSVAKMSLGAFVYAGQPDANYWRAAPIALDWIMISGTARYNAGFALPAQPLAADASTQLLINFEGPNPWTDRANHGASLLLGTGVAGGTAPTLSTDCNQNGIPDEAELGLPGADMNGNGLLDACEVPTCHDADLFQDGRINGADLGILLSQWGIASANTVSDINHDGRVDGADLGFLLSSWGTCNP